ncbi:hypothetical protein NUTIK01_32750 [Novosphingobium sp. IK01]|uniref:Uncharacterized protein n=1 Tax=Novosphingobium pituita TaxID=3056842 RepID=A0ABQ6PB84_9SPHN|nr:hypothetical protein [Novosphingobium sp. IK01]GMM62498.1 hypothetical protein NUTIK01_32750 [Novosphingobium sp. IK01]
MVTRAPRHHRGGDDDAILSQLRQQPMQAIPAGTSFVTDVQRHARSSQPLDQIPDRIVLVGDRADETHLTSSRKRQKDKGEAK